MNTNTEHSTTIYDTNEDKCIYWLMQEMNATIRTNDKLKSRLRSGGYVAWPGSKTVPSNSFVKGNGYGQS